MGSVMVEDLAFPQRATIEVEVPNPTTEATQRQAGPWFFKDGENVHFMRAEVVKDVRISGNTQCPFVDLELETKLYINRTVQTHDSVMHQFIDGQGQPGTLWLRIYFFTEDIFRVQFAMGRDVLEPLEAEPDFTFSEARMLVGKAQEPRTTYTATESGYELSSAAVRLQVQSKPFQLSATRVGGKAPFWKQRLSDLFTSDVIPTSVTRHQGREATFEAFQLSPGEAIYGLGERFDAVNRRGRTVDFVNHDAIGTTNTRTYINVPFLWSTAGYGCFVHSNARIEWDVGVSDCGTLGFSTEEKFMDYFVVSGDDPKKLLQRYTRDLTGKPRMPPTWSFGIWLSRNSYMDWATVDGVLERCKNEKIPVDVVHLDTYWFKEDWNPDLIFDGVRFAEPEAKIRKYLEDGIHTSLWQHTFTPSREDNLLYREGKAGGYLSFEKLSDGTKGPGLFKYPSGTSGWKTDDAVIDFSNPATRAWYAKKITSLIDMGVSAIKTDFGDCNPPDAWYHSTAGRRFQNTYALAYNATIASAMNASNTDTIIWSRSGTAGSQRFPVHWGGDSQCSFIALQGSFNATLALGMSGFPFFATDTGGFIGKPDPELYTRWAQMSLLAASHFRSHGAGDNNSREPWAFGTQALATFRKFANLRYQLLPYLIEQSRRSCELGVGVVRHLVLEWPQDRNVWHIESQCMVGDRMLVVPVLKPLSELDETMSVYFPRGRWYDFWTKSLVLESTGQWMDVPTPTLESMAIWVRGGSVLCYAKEERQRTFNQVGEVVRVECYGVSEGVDALEVGDGAGGTIRLVKTDGENWAVDGRQGVDVQIY